MAFAQAEAKNEEDVKIQEIGLKMEPKTKRNHARGTEQSLNGTFSILLRSLGLRCFLARDAPSSSSLSSPLRGLNHKMGFLEFLVLKLK